MNPDAAQITSHLSDRFWHFVDLARTDWRRFASELAKLPPAEVERLYWTYRAALLVFRSDDYEAAAPDDLMEDDRQAIAAWLVSMGRKSYMQIVEDADLMLYEMPPDAYPHGNPFNEIIRARHHDVKLPEDDDAWFR